MENLLKKLSTKLQMKLKDFGVSLVLIDEYNDIRVISDYDLHESYIYAIAAELAELGY